MGERVWRQAPGFRARLGRGGDRPAGSGERRVARDFGIFGTKHLGHRSRYRRFGLFWAVGVLLSESGCRSRIV